MTRKNKGRLPHPAPHPSHHLAALWLMSGADDQGQVQKPEARPGKDKDSCSEEQLRSRSSARGRNNNISMVVSKKPPKRRRRHQGGGHSPLYWYRWVPTMGRRHSLKCLLSITISHCCAPSSEPSGPSIWDFGSGVWCSTPEL